VAFQASRNDGPLTEFEIHSGLKNGTDAVAKAMELRPDLVIVEAASNPHAGLDTAEKLKRSLPRVPLFLVTQEHSMAAEREALHRGIDAVFKSDDLTSLVMNARAVCGLE
jgi:DNA-binding NarL/FixJ family response regulator